MEHEQEQQISKLTKKIERLEKETNNKQTTLEQVRERERGRESERERGQEGEGKGGGGDMEGVERGERERTTACRVSYFNSLLYLCYACTLHHV